MAGTVKFNRDYAEFGPKVEPYEKTEEVGWAIGPIFDAYHPATRLMDATISGQWLRKGEKEKGSKQDLDLLFLVPEGTMRWVEIILRDGNNAPRYAGYAFGERLDITDEIVNDYRVLVGVMEGGQLLRFEYEPTAYQEGGYVSKGVPASVDAARAVLRRNQLVRKAA